MMSSRSSRRTKKMKERRGMTHEEVQERRERGGNVSGVCEWLERHIRPQ